MKKNYLIITLLIISVCIMTSCSTKMAVSAKSISAKSKTTKKKKKEKKKKNKITMPYSSEDYVGDKWDVETLTKHFKDLGFKNIETSGFEPDEDDFRNNIFSVSIRPGIFFEKQWEKGDTFKAKNTITILYNNKPLLKKKNCPDLKTILTSKDMDYLDFAEKYDGHYVKFKGHVVYCIPDAYGIDQIIDVKGGDKSKKGLKIRIGDIRWHDNIDNDFKKGDKVTVIGVVDLSYSEYYRHLYVETFKLKKRKK